MAEFLAIRDENVEDRVLNALNQLLAKKSFEVIKVKDIIGVAQISRTTYYRHFGTKEEIISKFFARESVELTRFYRKHSLMTLNEMCIPLFVAWRKQAELLKNVINNDLTYLLIENIQKCFQVFLTTFTEKTTTTVKSEYEISFVTMGLVGVVITWIKNDMCESNEDLAKIITKLIKL